MKLLHRIMNGIPTHHNNEVKFGLRMKFIVFFLILVLIPFLSLSIIVYHQSAKIIEKNVYKSTLESMRQISKNTDYYLQEMERMTQLVMTNEELLDYLSNYDTLSDLEKIEANYKIEKFLLSISGLKSNLSGVYLFGSYGNFYYTRGRSPRLNYNYTNEKWFKDTVAKAGKINIIGTHLQYHVQNKPSYVISLARQIRDLVSREAVGVLLLDFDYGIFSEIINSEIKSTSKFSNNEKGGEETYIVDNEGTIIFHRNQQLLTKKFDQHFYTTILSDEYGVFTEKLNGKKMFVVFYTSPYSSWKFINVIPENLMLNDIMMIRNFIVAIMIISIILVVILSMEVSYKIVKPIYLLIDAMDEVESGNFSTNILIHTNDETKLLARKFNSMSQNINNLIQKVYRTQLQQKEAELNALQNQINPHFLYNTLESIRGVAITEGIPSISSMAKALSNLFRYNICKGKEVVTIKEEIEHIKNYITIQNFRYENKFEVEYNINEHLSSYKILKLILQPLIENAICHGLETKIGKGKIVISCEEQSTNLLFTISDNGIGMSEEKVTKLNQSLEKDVSVMQNSNSQNNTQNGQDKKIGIINVNSRIKLYFGEQYGLRFKSTEEIGTRVEVLIPAIKEVS